MATFRVNKTRDYTVISNHHLKNKELTLKAKGLLSVMLSLPDDWEYSINGLVAISKESKTSIRSAISELEKHGYINRTQTKDESGKFAYVYDIYEKPCTEKPCTENLYTVNPHTDNLCTEKIPNKYTKEPNTKRVNTKEYIYSVSFETFWSEYPRKKEKAKAYKCYQTRLKDGWTEEQLLKSCKNYAQYCKDNGTEERYIKLCATFLSASTPFTDYFEPQKQKTIVKKNAFNSFPQRDYNLEDMERKLLGL